MEVFSVTATLCIIIVVLHCTRGQSYMDAVNLKTALYEDAGYRTDVRPVINQSTPTEVLVQFFILSIIGLEPSSGEIGVNGFITCVWMDEMLTWNPANYSGISKLSLSSTEHWKPEISINGEGIKGMLLSGMTFTNSYVYDNGLLLWKASGEVKSLCKLDFKLYPFDGHVCEFPFFVTNYDRSDVYLTAASTEADFSFYVEHGEWDIQSSSVEVRQPTKDPATSISSISYSFVIKRRPGYTIINTILPLIILIILNLMATFVPPSSGERIGYAATFYLAFVFTAIASAEDFPRSSLILTYFSVSLLMTNVTIGLGVLWSVLVVRLAARSDTSKIPRILKYLVTITVKWRNSQKVNPLTLTEGQTHMEETKVEDIPQSISGTDDLGEEDNVTWPQITAMLDRLYFVFAVIASLAAAFTVLIPVWLG